MHSLVGCIYIYISFFLQHPLLPEAPTSSTSHLSTFPGRVSEPEPGWGAPWGCWAPHTVNFLQKHPLAPLGIGLSHGFFLSSSSFFFLAELLCGSGKAPRLKSPVWSTVITSGVLNPWRGVCGGGNYAMGGRESRAETVSESFSCNSIISSSVCVLLSTCCSAPCPSAGLGNSCWGHLSLEERPISAEIR